MLRGDLHPTPAQLDMAVVFTAGGYNRYGFWRHLRDDVVAPDIIAAVVRR